MTYMLDAIAGQEALARIHYLYHLHQAWQMMMRRVHFPSRLAQAARAQPLPMLGQLPVQAKFILLVRVQLSHLYGTNLQRLQAVPSGSVPTWDQATRLPIPN